MAIVLPQTTHFGQVLQNPDGEYDQRRVALFNCPDVLEEVTKQRGLDWQGRLCTGSERRSHCLISYVTPHYLDIPYLPLILDTAGYIYGTATRLLFQPTKRRWHRVNEPSNTTRKYLASLPAIYPGA